MSENRRRQCQILVRFSQEELSIIKVKAEKAGLTEASFLRESALGKKIVAPSFSQEEEKIIKRQIKGIGNNLNQLTKLAHERKIKGDGLVGKIDCFKEVTEKLWQLLCSAIQSERGH